MKRLIGMFFLVGLFVGGFVFIDSAPQAAEAKPKAITWMGQSCLPPGMPVSVGLQDLCERVKKASGGRFILTAKPAGSVCPATKEWQAINKGGLDFAAAGGAE